MLLTKVYSPIQNSRQELLRHNEGRDHPRRCLRDRCACRIRANKAQGSLHYRSRTWCDSSNYGRGAMGAVCGMFSNYNRNTYAFLQVISRMAAAEVTSLILLSLMPSRLLLGKLLHTPTSSNTRRM